MKQWQHVVKIGDILTSDDIPLETIRDGVVERLRASSAMLDGDKGAELSSLVEELAEVDDIHSYNWVMSAIYDLGDEDKWLWVGY